MKRSLALVLCLLALAALAAGLAGLITPPAPVYSVDQLQAALRQQPRAWSGRVVSVRGVVVWFSYSYGPIGPQALSGNGGTLCGPLAIKNWRPSRCTALMRFMLTQIPSGATVHLAFAPHSIYFPAAAVAHPTLFLRAHPALAVPLVLHSGSTPPDPLPPLLRRIPFLRSLLPPPPTAMRATFSGIYRVRVVLPSPSARRPQPGLELVVLGVS